jgi:hypothetical protein
VMDDDAVRCTECHREVDEFTAIAEQLALPASRTPNPRDDGRQARELTRAPLHSSRSIV